MKTIRTLLTITAAITLGESTLWSTALGDEAQTEPAAAPIAATAAMTAVTPAAAVGQAGVRKDGPSARTARTSDGIERRCERVERIGKFVTTHCH